MRNLESENYFEDDVTLEDYGDIMNANDVAIDASVRAEVVNYLANDPTFFTEVVSNPLFLDKITKNSQFCDALAKSSRAMTNVVNDSKVLEALASSTAFTSRVIAEILQNASYKANILQQAGVIDIASIVMNDSHVHDVIREEATFNFELVGDDGNIVALAESRNNVGSEFEYFFDPVVARDNPNAKIRISFAKTT